MAITFQRQDGVWNPRTRAVHFFGDDQGRSIMFTVPAETLVALTRTPLFSEREILRSYSKYLAEIRDAAMRIYEKESTPGPGLAYVLKSDHFNGPPA